MFKTKKEKLEKETLKSEIENIDQVQEKQDSAEELSEQTNDTLISTVDEVSNKLQDMEKQISELKDQLLRKTAEFQNYKRRTESEISRIYKMASESLIMELLPVLDDFDRMMKTWDENHDVETLGKGIGLIYEKFRKVLNEQGLREIESEGKPFDFNLHDAVMQQAAEDIEPDLVTAEIEKGYYLKDKVIRHAKVIVSKKP